MEGSTVLNTVQPMITTMTGAFTASDLVAIIGSMLPYAVGIVVVWIAFRNCKELLHKCNSWIYWLELRGRFSPLICWAS